MAASEATIEPMISEGLSQDSQDASMAAAAFKEHYESVLHRKMSKYKRARPYNDRSYTFVDTFQALHHASRHRKPLVIFSPCPAWYSTVKLTNGTPV